MPAIAGAAYRRLRAASVSAWQKIEEESRPPLTDTATGYAERLRRATASSSWLPNASTYSPNE